jgi:hypothetical protein
VLIKFFLAGEDPKWEVICNQVHVVLERRSDTPVDRCQALAVVFQAHGVRANRLTCRHGCESRRRLRPAATAPVRLRAFHSCGDVARQDRSENFSAVAPVGSVRLRPVRPRFPLWPHNR